MRTLSPPLQVLSTTVQSSCRLHWHFPWHGTSLPRSTIHIHVKVTRHPVCSLCLTTDHSATFVILFCFSFVFFRFQVKIVFWLLKKFLLCVFSRFFTPHLPSPYLLQDRGAEAAEPIKEQLKPIFTVVSRRLCGGIFGRKTRAGAPWHISHQFMFPSWDPCAPHLCVKV